MNDVVICDPVRTPVGAFGGVFASLTATDLARSALRSLVDRTGLGPDDVDDVVLGRCSPSGEAPAIGRLAVDPDATVTAGNASGQNDGAALCIVTTRACLREWDIAAVFNAALLAHFRSS